jgi:hypothetical protein
MRAKTWTRHQSVGRRELPPWHGRPEVYRASDCSVSSYFSTVSSRMITGSMAIPRITGNMNKPSGPTIFTGS